MNHARWTSCAATIVWVIAAAPVFAQDQGEWLVRDFDGFSVSAPADLQKKDSVFTGVDGKTYPAQVYSLVQGKQIYSVTVADFTTAPVEDDPALDYVIQTLAKQGKIAYDVPSRSAMVYGRELNLVRRDNSQSMFSIYYTGKHLYLTEGKTLPPDAEDGSSSSTRFAESIAFPLPARPPRPPRPAGAVGPPPRPAIVPNAPSTSREPVSVTVAAPTGAGIETWRWSPDGTGEVQYCRQAAKSRPPTCVVADNPKYGDHMPPSQTTPMISAVMPGQAWIAIGGTTYFCKHTSYVKGSATEVTCQDAGSRGLPREIPTSVKAMSDNAARFIFPPNRSYYCQNVPAEDDSKSQTFLTCVVL
jgi:hypothetical protein